MIPSAKDRLHELLINDAQRRMNNAFMIGNIDLAHEQCNEFGRLIQKRSKEMIELMERDQGILNHVVCVGGRRAGDHINI